MTRIDQAFLRSMPMSEPGATPTVVEPPRPETVQTEAGSVKRSRVAAPHFALRPGGVTDKRAEEDSMSQGAITPEPAPGPALEPIANRPETPPSSSCHTETQAMAIDTRNESQDILPLPSSQAIVGRANPGSPFVPALEVDAFLIPAICRKMADRLGSTALAPVAQALASAARRGCCLGGLLGWGAASGCTTTVLSTALLLADRGKRVLVIDAAENAALTSLLGLEIELGWDTSPDPSLRELVIRSLEDRFDLLPKSTLAATSRPGIVTTTAGRAFQPLWRRLAELTVHYAFILIDLGSEPAERHPSQRVLNTDTGVAQAGQRMIHESDLAAACDVLFFVRDARRRHDARFAPPPSTPPTSNLRPRTFIIDNFAPGV
ncbi:MAG: hypothetical protein ACUVTW_02120 [Thermogutta sp.]